MSNCSIEWTVGMDLGDKNHVLCLLDSDGEVVRRGPVCNTARALRKAFSRFREPGTVRVAMETGTHSPWISHMLSDMGFEVLVGNARKLRAIWTADRKNDWRDAEMLARISRFDTHLLYPIRHRSMSAQAHLAVIRSRDALVRCRSSLISSARGLVKSSGGRLPKCSAPSFAKTAAEAVPPELEPALGPMLSQIAALSEKIRTYDRCIERLCDQTYGETARIRQIPGVGAITALAFVLTVEDPDRFEQCRSMGPFLGLVPGQDQSGETDRAQSLSKAGDHYLRRLLTQSAHYILGPFGPDCDLRRFGLRLAERKGRRGKAVAAAAVARKLSILMLKLWKTGETYQPLRRRSPARSSNGKAAA